MVTSSVVHIPWKGAESIRLLRDALAHHEPVELRLPPDFHHALFTHVHPDAAPGTSEEIDVSGGAELLTRIAEVRGLEAIAELTGPAVTAGARVRVLSPAPRVCLSFPSG